MARPRGVWGGAVDRGGTQVHVRGVQAIALDLEPGKRLDCREAVVAQPVRFAALGDERLDERAVEERDLELGERAAHARRSRDRRGLGDLRHPSDPSISSLTSRLNSMAYSIGSSLVNTSRKPCTMRFVASFSVRPRDIR